MLEPMPEPEKETNAVKQTETEAEPELTPTRAGASTGDRSQGVPAGYVLAAY